MMTTKAENWWRAGALMTPERKAEIDAEIAAKIKAGKSLKEQLREMMAQPIPKAKKPNPAAEVLAGPWPRKAWSEAELIRRQQEIDYWWEQHRARLAERHAGPTPEEKLREWIWGRGR